MRQPWLKRCHVVSSSFPPPPSPPNTSTTTSTQPNHATPDSCRRQVIVQRPHTRSHARSQARTVECRRPGEQAPEETPSRPRRHRCRRGHDTGGNEGNEAREEKRGEGEKTKVRTLSTSIARHRLTRLPPDYRKTSADKAAEDANQVSPTKLTPYVPPPLFFFIQIVSTNILLTLLGPNESSL